MLQNWLSSEFLYSAYPRCINLLSVFFSLRRIWIARERTQDATWVPSQSLVLHRYTNLGGEAASMKPLQTVLLTHKTAGAFYSRALRGLDRCNVHVYKSHLQVMAWMCVPFAGNFFKKIKSQIQMLFCLIEISYGDVFLDFVQVYRFFYFPSR